MQEYLDDPSVLTKDKLKSELLANNVALPSGNPPKDVYVQLYIQNLSAQNQKRAADAFSSDDEPPPPAVSGRSRSSGRKTSRKPDKVQPDELDVTALTDEGLRAELLKLGVDAGPVVATTRKLYEKKLQELLQDGAAQPQLVHAETQVNHNGSEADLYSDKEDEATAEPEPKPRPVAEPEPAPVAERPARSQGKMPVTGRTRGSQHHTRERFVDGEDPEDESVLNVRRRSRRFSDRTTLAEVRRPVLAGQKQSVSNISDHRKPDRPARAQLRSTSQMPAESKSLPEDQSPRRATKPSPATVDPVTFSPMCNISPIKSRTSPWTASDQAASRPSGVSAGGEQCGRADAWPLGRRQQKITSLVSEHSLAKTHSCTSQDVLARQVEKIAAGDQSTKVDERDVLKELFPSLAHTPTGISATCRRPIRGAAGRPVKSSDLWNFETSLFSPQMSTKASGCSSSYTEKLSRVTGLPSSTPPTSRTSRLLAAPPAGHRLSLWIKLLLLATVATFLFLVYQAMETNTDAPFGDSEVSRG